ncbi:EAL domain-containing protein [uncultured Boseongicola sp.]|uniref:EAL domain-containing protein n=1 Tax=uncultured Boseongicola sp. TaxID=1648499 RepID=UPI003434C19F
MPRSAGMVRSIMDLWRALEIKITAESVEPKAHTPLLADLGCDRFQGYCFGRPRHLPMFWLRGGQVSPIGPRAVGSVIPRSRHSPRTPS